MGMGLNQYKALVDNRKELDILSDEEKLISADLKKEAEAVRVMVVSTGWKAIRRYFEGAIKLKMKQLSLMDLKSNDALVVQSEITAMSTLLSFVENRLQS